VQLTLIAVFFLLIFAIVLTGVGLGLRYLETERKKAVRKVLATTAGSERLPEEASLLSDGKADLANVPLLSELPFFQHLTRSILQAGLTWKAGAVVGAMFVLAVLGALLASRVRIPLFREFAIVAMAGGMGSLPYLLLMHKRRKRMAEFEQQFPEALDFLARSMRAGHAFSVSLEMLADESPDPVGMEFRQVFHEQNLGAPIDVAMRNLAERVPMIDVNFFVSAVLLQRETGGNLAEILTKLAYVIRERFRLKGQVKAVSAHGRMTALVLSAMPLVTMLLLSIIAPQYLAGLAADPDGRIMIICAISGQLLGYVWMKKVINIKV
jgi:tight adherence protein B